MTLHASARNPIPPGATFRVSFPLELRAGLERVSVARSDGVDGDLTILVVREDGVVEVSRVDGAEVEAGGRVAVTLGGVQTPYGAVTTGAFNVELLSAEGALIDTASLPPSHAPCCCFRGCPASCCLHGVSPVLLAKSLLASLPTSSSPDKERIFI